MTKVINNESSNMPAESELKETSKHPGTDLSGKKEKRVIMKKICKPSGYDSQECSIVPPGGEIHSTSSNTDGLDSSQGSRCSGHAIAAEIMETATIIIKSKPTSTIKVTAYLRESKEALPFPKYMVNKEKNLLVLFQDETTGTVIDDQREQPAGVITFTNSWDPKDFIDVTGKLIMGNNY